MPLDGWGVTKVTTSPGLVEVCSTTRGLFRICTVWGGGGGGGGRRLTLALWWLLLPGLPGTGHKVVDHHGLPGHHVSTTIGLGVRKVSDVNSFLLSWLCENHGFTRLFGLGRSPLYGSLFHNSRMSKFSKTSGHALLQFFPQRHKLVWSSISPTKFPSFSCCKFQWKEVCMPNVDVGQKGHIYQERLPERLPSRVDGLDYIQL